MKVLFCKKRILSMFLAMVLAIGMIPSSTFAAIATNMQTNGGSSILENSGLPENNMNQNSNPTGGELAGTTGDAVAQIGENLYATLAKAIEAATAGQTIKLLADVSENVTISKSVTIDGNEKTFSGKITHNEGTLKITNATLFAEQTFVIETTSDVEIDNCTLTSSQTASNYYGSRGIVNAKKGNCDVSIEDCTISNLYYTVYFNQSGSSLTIENCTITDCVYISSSQKCKVVTIKNVTYSGMSGLLVRSAVDLEVNFSNVDINVTLNGQNPLVVSTNEGSKKVTINLGGNNKFSANGVEYEGNTWTSYENITINDVNVAQVGDKKFESFDDAVAYAKSGNTIKLLADYTGDAITLPKGVELDANGFNAGDITEVPIVYVAQIGDNKYETLSEAFAAVRSDNDTVTILTDVTENLTGAYLRGNIVGNATITLTNSDWVYCPYTFVIGEGITLNVPALFYYAGGSVIRGDVVTDVYYQRYAGTKLTIEAPGSLTVTSETFIIRYMDGDPDAGIYIVGDNDDSTVELNLVVAYFYQGMINAKDATIKCGTYWQTNEIDGQGSANLVLDNSKLTVTVYEHAAKATGNSTVTLKNGSVMNCQNGGFAYDDNAELSVDDTSSIIDKNGEAIKIPLSGSGTEANPYIINSVNDLILFRDSVNAGETTYNAPGVYVTLGADIDLGGSAWRYINTFYGKFDGKDHTISNFTIDATAGYAAFFYKTASKDGVTPASIENLILSNITATVGKNRRVAALVVSYNKTDIKNVTVKDFTVTTTGASAWIAGLACAGTVNSEVTMSNCTVENFTVTDKYGAQFISGISAVLQRNGSEADGTNVLDNLHVKNFKIVVTGIVANGSSTAVGGLIGQTQTVWLNPHFKNCSVTDLDVTATGRVDVGGFMAHPGSWTYTTNCTVAGKIDVTRVTSSSNYAGGFYGDFGWGDNVGKGDHIATNCSADVDIITNVATAGGFVGSGINTENRNKKITLNNCKAEGAVTCVEGGTATIGGFAGNADRGIYNACSAPEGLPFIGKVLEGTNTEVTCVASVGNTYYATLADAIKATQTGDTIKLLADYTGEAITLPEGVMLDANGKSGADKITVVIPTYVAQIGEVGYKTLADALAAATAGQTITFLADINENVTINKAVTIEGKKSETENFQYTGKMTIAVKDANVTIQNVKFTNGHILSDKDTSKGTTLKISNCEFDGQNSINHAMEIANFKQLIIEGGTIKNYKLSAVYVKSAQDNDVIINGTTIESIGSYAIRIASGEGLNLNGVTIKNVYGGVLADTAKNYTFTNCTFENVTLPLTSWSYTLTGKFIFNETNTIPNLSTSNGGTFVLSVGATLTAPEGLKITPVDTNYIVEYKDGVYKVSNPVAKIGDTIYSSLADAITAAQAGDTIILLKDVNESVTIGKNLTIDGGEFNYTGTMNIGTTEIVTIQNVNFVKGCIDGNTSAQSRKLTIKDCTFDGVDKSIGYAITVRHGKSVTIENCTATNYGTGMLYVPQSVTNITITNVTVANVAAAFNISYSGDATFEKVKFENVTYGIHFQIHANGSRTYTVKNSDLSGATNPFWFWDKSNNTAKVTVVFEGENTVPNFQSTIAGYLKLALGATLTAPEGLTITTTKDGYSVKYEDGKYFVKANMVAIGDNTYASLAEALAAANAGDIITFLDNITEDVTVNKAVTIDGKKSETENFQYTGKIKISGDVDVTIQNVNFVKGYIEQNGTATSATLTVKNCSFANGGYAITTERIKNLIIEDCTVTKQSLLYAKLATLNIVVKDVTVTGGNYVAHIVYGNTALFENVKAKEMTGYGIFTQNYGSKTITIRNCEFDTPKYTSIGVNETRSAAVDTFIFEGKNTMTSLEDVFAAKYVLGTSDATLTAPANYNVTTNVDRYVVKYVDGVYKLNEAVAQIGTTYYDSLQAAIAAAEDGNTIVILKKITVDDAEKEAVKLGSKYKTLFNITGKSITIDLNGNELSCDCNISGMLIGFFATENGGHLTLKDSSENETGTVKITANGTTVYCLLTAFDSTASMTIESGNYILDNASNSLVYADGDETITVNGGNFRLGNIGTGSNGSPWIFNTSGQNTKNIIVNGGTFNANVMKQYYEFEVQSEKSVACVEVESGIWQISAATVLLGEESTSSPGYIKWVGYRTFAEAYEAADEGETIKLLADITIDFDMTKDVTILKGDDYEVTIQNAKFYAGTYDWDVTKYVANGYCVKAEEGTCNVHAHIRAEKNENEHAPTCDSDGYYELVVYCECCNTEFSRTQITITATGHTEGEVQIENKTDATCDAAGAYHKVIYCTVCNKELEREHVTIPALGHTKGEVVKQNEVGATCDTDGYYEEVVYCATCKEPMSSTIIKTEDAHNHKITMEMDPATGFVLTFYFDACDSVNIVNINGTAVAKNDWTKVSEGHYCVEYNEISAKDIDKTIYVQLISDRVVSQIENISVANYIKAELNKTDISDEYRNLLKAMLDYGTAAKKYLSNKESCTIDNSLNGNYDACNELYKDSYKLEDANEHYLGARVVGDSTLKLEFLFYFANTTEINVKVQFGDRILVADEFDVVADSKKPGRYMVSVEIPANCMSEVITCVASVGDDTASITYSVESYAFESFYFADEDYGKRQELVTAMMAYGNAAAEYKK